MIKILIKTGLFFFLFQLNFVYAETYSYMDEHGTVNFTEDIASVPKKYRKKIKRYDDLATTDSTDKDSSDRSQITSAKSAKTPSLFKSNSSPDKVDASANYGGKSYEQWHQDFKLKESSMNSIKSRIEEIDTQIRKKGVTNQIVENRKQLIKHYNDERIQYDTLVEAARKAGLKIEMKADK